MLTGRPAAIDFKNEVSLAIIHLDAALALELTLKQFEGDRILNRFLDDPFEGARPVRGIETGFRQPALGLAGQFERDVPVFQTFFESAELYVNNLADVLFLQTIKDDDLIDTVEEFLPEPFL